MNTNTNNINPVVAGQLVLIKDMLDAASEALAALVSPAADDAQMALPLAESPAALTANAVRATVAPLQAIISALDDPRYALRSLKSLCDVSGLSTQAEIEDELAVLPTAYVTRRRRFDGALMYGWAYRNE